MSNSYKEYASKEYVNSVVVSHENIEQIVADSLAEAKAYTDKKVESGISSWDDLTDKPFGEDLVESIEWNNNPEGRYSVTIGSTVYTHLSDITFSDPSTELIGSHLVSNNSMDDSADMDVIIDGTQYAITQMPGTDLMWLTYMLVFVPEDNYTLNMGGDNIFVFEKKGIYVMGSSWESIKITFANPVSEIKKIDEKYLPDTVATKADIIGAMEASY